MEFLKAVEKSDVYFLQKELSENNIRLNDTIRDRRSKSIGTPLVKACEVGNQNIVELFLQHDADVNRSSQASNGATPLYTA